MDTIDTLRKTLEHKIELDWNSKWHSFGIYDIDKLNRRAKFYEALAADISHISHISVSRDTVQRFNKGEGGDSKASLHAFSKYLGYTSFEDYSSKNTENPSSKSNQNLILISILTLLSGVMIHSLYVKPQNEKKEIVKVIIHANEVQFNIFKSMKLSDSTKLEDLYTKNSTARKSIMTLLKESQKNKRRINFPEDNPSFSKVHDVRVINVASNVAVVETTEHWFLKWYDTELGKYTVSYNQKNKQIYELEKENNNWKIKNNYYEGKASKIDY